MQALDRHSGDILYICARRIKEESRHKQSIDLSCKVFRSMTSLFDNFLT